MQQEDFNKKYWLRYASLDGTKDAHFNWFVGMLWFLITDSMARWALSQNRIQIITVKG